MDFWLWPLYFLPVSGALRILPEVKVEGELGGSVTIKCPLPEMHVRIYLCREMAGSGTCGTVVSTTNFIKAEYKGRVTLKQYPHKNLFLVENTSHHGKSSQCLRLQNGFICPICSRCLHMPVLPNL
ncbi:FCMR isoform 8 [Pan troglodytes]|uniref:FCMR isoform 8 n=1 Tax=Pan troglodytes TaxID=9598 RepID=A0A2J8QVT7_PANTR|nr:FCMR isoform 8 [Pan troglodytes]